MAERPWSGLQECESGYISNFDFAADDGVEEELRTGKRYCEYTGWDFCGYVWFADGKFKCDVWRYKSPVEIIEADTIEALMHAVSEEYGYA